MQKLMLLTFFILTSSMSFCQNSYINFLVHDSCIWALTTEGDLKLFEYKTGRALDRIIPSKGSFSYITLNKSGDVMAVNDKNEVCKYVPEGVHWEVISKLENESYGILFASDRHGYSIINEGIEDLNTHQIYSQDKSLNSQIRIKRNWGKPYCIYIDKRGIIWEGFGHGEWGGDLFLFETSTNKFITPQLDSFEIELWPIKSFFEDSLHTYLSAGLDHMYTSGTIVQFRGLLATVILNSNSHWKDLNSHDMDSMVNGHYIGPAAYNSYNNSIYFYSQYGFFRGNLGKDLSDIKNWDLIVKPNLKWVNGQPDAAGSPMNVLKLEAIDDKRFVFLSQQDGIGIFDGKEIKMLN